MNRIRTFISSKINSSNERSANAVKNIIASFGIRGVSIAVSLLLVPLTIDYVNPTQYGIWLTLSSVVAWFAFFDIGFGNGLRNRFAEAKATGDFAKARAYVSTTYVCLGVIFTLVWVLFFCVNFFIDWSRILNAPAQMAKELSLVAITVFSFFCTQIVLKTINTVLIADQKPAKSSFFDMLGQVIALMIIFVLTKTTSGSLLYLALALGFSTVMIMIVSSCWFYSREYKRYRPSFRLFERNVVRDILSLGGKFFLIQIAGIVMFQSANIIISQLSSPQDVTVYNVVYKYFSVVTMVFNIILGTLWSAYTDAYAKGDMKWIVQVVSKMVTCWKLFLVLTVVMLVASPWIYILWLGTEVASLVPFSISILCAVYVSIFSWSSIYAFFLNGVGKIKIQLYVAVSLSILYIPLAISLNIYFGVNGIIGALCIVSVIAGVLVQIQYKKIIKQKATGIWNE